MGRKILVDADDLANVRDLHDDCGYANCDAIRCLSYRRLRAALAADRTDEIARTIHPVRDYAVPGVYHNDLAIARAVLGVQP